MRAVPRRDEAIRHFQRGMVLERAGRIAEAVQAYRQAIVAYPYMREAHDALGLYYRRQGLLTRAADEFRAAVKIEGDYFSLFNLGYVLIELGHYDEALEAFNQCLAFAPDDPAAHYEIGYIHFNRGDFNKALAELEQPLRLYPEDWEVHNLIGNIHLRRGRYDDALHAFHRALTLASSAQAQAELFESLTTVERHREFRQLSSTKDQLYAQEGVVYLGSSQDDGLVMGEVADYYFTYPDIATTLQRFLALQQSCRWAFTAVVPLDKTAQPLARALSARNGLPLRTAAELRRDDFALLMLGVLREGELLELMVERAVCLTAAFCLGLNWARPGRRMPELIGIVARDACTVPWEAELRRLRASGAPAEQIEACLSAATAQILQALHETPLDDNLPRQVRYYTRQHRRLSFPGGLHSFLNTYAERL